MRVWSTKNYCSRMLECSCRITTNKLTLTSQLLSVASHKVQRVAPRSSKTYFATVVRTPLYLPTRHMMLPPEASPRVHRSKPRLPYRSSRKSMRPGIVGSLTPRRPTSCDTPTSSSATLLYCTVDGGAVTRPTHDAKSFRTGRAIRGLAPQLWGSGDGPIPVILDQRKRRYLCFYV